MGSSLRLGLRARLLLLGLLALAPLLALHLWNAHGDRADARVHAAIQARAAARQVVARHEQWLAEIEATLDAFALSPSVAMHEGAVCSNIAMLMKRQQPSVTNIWAALPSGAVFCSSQPLTEPVSNATRPWFQEALASKRFTVGSYQVGGVTGRAILPVARPVLDDEGNVVAVLASALDLAWLQRSIVSAVWSEPSTITIVDRAGVVLARGDDTGWQGRSIADAPVGALLLGANGTTHDIRDLDGVPRIFGVADSGGESGLHVLVGVTSSVITAQADRDLVSGLLLTALVTLLACLIAVVGSNLMVLRPVRRLIAVSRRVGAGETGVRAGVRRQHSEIDDLAHAFDEMAVRLDEARQETERSHAALAAREAQLARVVETSAQGLMLMNAAGQVVMANAAAQRIFAPNDRRPMAGRSTLAKTGRRFELDGAPMPEDRHPFRQVKETGAAIHDFEYLWELDSGERVTISVSAAPVWTADGAFDGVVTSIADVTARKRQESELELLAFYDGLTSLPNRRLFSERLTRALVEQERDDDELAVLFIDLDGFKAVNDQHGHGAGDVLLAEIGKRLHHCLWPGDSAARFGGDEFAILSPRVVQRAHILALADDVLAAIAQPVAVPGAVAHVSGSIGVAFVRGRGLAADQVLREADAALYRAKRAGKARYVVTDVEDAPPLPTSAAA